MTKNIFTTVSISVAKNEDSTNAIDGDPNRFKNSINEIKVVLDTLDTMNPLTVESSISSLFLRCLFYL